MGAAEAQEHDVVKDPEGQDLGKIPKQSRGDPLTHWM